MVNYTTKYRVMSNFFSLFLKKVVNIPIFRNKKPGFLRANPKKGTDYRKLPSL